MQKNLLKIMAVDDDAMNLEIMMKNLKDAGFEPVGFEDGDIAWNYLKQHPEDIDIILLDKMMPRMDGMEVLSKIKSDKKLQGIPVILQTGDIGVEETKEGLAKGAHYYLEKPFDPSVMVSLVQAAARDSIQQNATLEYLKQDKSVASLLYKGIFYIRTIDDARHLASALSVQADRPKEISIALAELLVNAVEHGNLNIAYDTKTILLNEGKWETEIGQRLKMAENAKKFVTVDYLRDAFGDITVTIKDQGKGFRWKDYLDFDPLRLTDPNGRGIAAARLVCPNIEFLEEGSKVICRFHAKDKTK